MTLLSLLQVPNYGHADFPADRWINADIRPLPPSRRTWTGLTYMTWWSVWQLSITSFQLGASLVALGLSVWQAMLAIIIARVLTAALAVLSGMPGAEWHVGYPVLSRAIWGVYGAYIPMLIRIFLLVVAMAVQTFIGGLCITAILSAIFPTFHSMRSSIPASEDVTAQQIIGWIVFNVLAGVLMYTRPEKSNRTIAVLSGVSFVTMLGIMIWAVNRAGGGGPLLSAPGAAQAGEQLGWSFLNGIFIAYGGTAIASLSQSDFSRFARAPRDQVAGQWVSFCVIGVVTPLFGCLTASATAVLYKQPIWNPPVLALTWLQVDYSATSRAGAFFVGLGLVCSQLGVTTVDNGYSAGMDLAGLFPRFFNIRRGAYVVLVVGMALVPWKLIATARTFTLVIGSFVIFVSPMLGILIADYWIVRGRKLKLSHLYTADRDGIYYFNAGVNWRVLAAWLVGFVPCLPGLIALTSPAPIAASAVHLYQLTWIYGFLSAMLVHYGLMTLLPVPGIGQVDAADEYGTFTEEEAAKLGIRPQDSQPASSSGSMSEVIAISEKPNKV